MELNEQIDTEAAEKKKQLRSSSTIKLQGKEYLQVAGRVAMVRVDHPGWSIMTGFEQVKIDPADDHPVVVARASITDENGAVLATATKTVRREGRGPASKYPLEMAETGAIGRALALCGYGTLSGDLDEGDQIADAPVTRKW